MFRKLKELIIDINWKSSSKLIGIMALIFNTTFISYDIWTKANIKIILGFFGFIAIISGAALLTYGRIIVFRKRRQEVSNLTHRFAKTKNYEFMVAYAILFCLCSVVVYSSYFEILPLVAGFSFCLIATQLLTNYRIQSGRFGYNASEMKELIYFVSKSGSHDSIPPGSTGLKTYPNRSANTVSSYGNGLDGAIS